MTDTLNSFEGGTDTTAISTANSGGTSGTAFDVTSTPTGTTLAFSSTHVAHGGMAMFASPGATVSSPSARWTTTVGSLSTVWVRAYIYLTGYPAAQNRLIEFRSGAAAVAATLRMNTNGTLSAGGASGTAVTTTTVVPLNQWVRVEMMAVGSATAGQVEIKLFTSMDSSTATETQTSGTTLNTTGTFNEYRFGLPATNTASDPGVWFDDIGVSSTGYLGAAATGGGSAAVDASSPALASSAFASVTSAAFTPPNDVVVVACVASSAATSSVTLSVSNNGAALTWHQMEFINSVAGKKGAVGIYWATLPGAHGRTGLTVTATVGGGAFGVVLKVYVLAGADTTSPQGNHASGSNNLTSTTTTSFATTRAASMGFVVAEDNNGGTMSSSDTTDVSSTDSGGNGRNAVFGYKTLGASGSSATFNVTTTGTPANDWAVGEIKASAAQQGAVSMGATAGLAAAGTRDQPGALVMPGAAALTTGATQTNTAAAAMAAAAALSSAGVRGQPSGTALTGTAGLTAAGLAVDVAAVTMPAGTTLLADGSTQLAALAAAGSLTTGAVATDKAAVALTGGAALTSMGLNETDPAAFLAGTSALVAVGVATDSAAVTMAATGHLDAAGLAGSPAKFAGTARLNTDVSLVLAPSVALNAVGGWFARAVLAFLVPHARPGATSVQVRANPGVTPIQVRVPTAGFTPARPVAGLPYASEVQVSRDTGRSNALVALTGVASLTVPAGTLRAAAAVALTGIGSLTSTVSGAGAASLSATGTFAAGAVDVTTPSAAFAATGSLTAAAVPATPVAVSMSADTTLTGSGTSAVTFPHNMTAVVTSDNAIHLSWDAVPGATTYKLYEDQSLSGVSGATALTTTTSVRTPSTLRTYNYWVTATVGGVESAISNKATAVLPYSATGGGTGGGTPTSFTMGFGSCINAADSNALAVCATMNPDYFAQCGDVFYDDGSSGLAAHWDAQFGAPGYSALLTALAAKGPLSERHIYTWSDHEGFANNAVAPAFITANTAWRSYPAFSGVPVPASGIYNSFTIGRVLFIKVDERTFKDDNAKTDDANKTILGATQKAWFSNLIATATNALIVIIGDVPITTPTVAGDDAWSGYNTERLWMQGILNASSATFIRLSGNMHCLAKTSNSFGYDRAWQAAGLNQATKVSAGGTGLGASYPTNANEGSTLQLFGMVTFTDDGTQIAVSFSGYEATSATAKTLRLSDTITVSAPSSGGGTGGGRGTPAQILNINGVGTGGGGNWNEGIGFHPGDAEGSTHQDIPYATVAGGYNRTPYFTPNTDGTGVQFQVYCDGGTTSSNTHYPRSEMRELTAGGGANQSFSGSSGTHKMSGTTRVMHGTSTKDEVVIAQIHDGSDDTLQILVVGTTVVFSIKGTRQAASLTGLAKGTWFDWAIALTNGQLTISLNGVQKYNSNPGYGSGQYFKVGCYAQAASGYTSGITAADYFTVELKNLLTSHA